MKFLLVTHAVRTASVFAVFLLSAAWSRVQAAPPREVPQAVQKVSAEEISGLTFSRGSIESVLAARAGNYFSTTQKVNGYTAERAAEAYAMGKLLTGEDYEDKDVMPVEGDVLPFRVSLLGGYTDNLHLLPDGWDHGSAFFGAGVRSFNMIQRPRGQAYIGLNLEGFYLEDHQYARDGGNSFLRDFTLNTGGTYKLGKSAALALRSQYDYTSFGTMGLGVARPGVLFDDVLRTNSDTKLHYRFDGRGLNDPGLAATTSLFYTIYDEQGGGYGDFYRLQLAQEFAWNQGGPLTYYAQGRAGWTGFQDLDQYDGAYFAGMIGARGACPNCGLNFDIAAGAERWSYDDAGLRDRTSFRVEASVEGKLTDRLGLRATGAYGIHSLLPNAGVGLIDAEGFRGQLRATYTLNDKATLGLYAEYQDLNGNIRRGVPTVDQGHEALGADLHYKVSENIILTPGLLWLNTNGDGPDGDAIIGTLRTTFTF